MPISMIELIQDPSITLENYMFVTAGKKVQNVPKLRVKLNLFLTFKDKKGTDFDQPHARKR